MSQGRLGRPFLVKSVTVTIDGVTHQGTYYVQRSIVYVRSPLGEKARHATRSNGKAAALGDGARRQALGRLARMKIRSHQTRGRPRLRKLRSPLP
jgi:hypothetical protein